MAHPSSRRVPSPNPRYYAVPQSPQQHPNYPYGQQQQRRPSRSNRTQPANERQAVVAPMPPRNDLAQGAGYGPYSHPPTAAAPTGHQQHTYTASRYSVPASEQSSVTGERPMLRANTSTVPAYMWDTKDPDLDDALHNPDPRVDAAQDNSFTLFSGRGWANVSVLVLLMAGLITLFAGYPILSFYRETPLAILGNNFGGGNGTGQIPDLPNTPTLIDSDTPKQFYTKTASDGSTWNLVFSDEFNQAGRTFWPGDDPYWEAVDLHYWPTGDLEWYNPQAITTSGGNLVITLTEQSNHNLNFQSGMLQSWNKFCFTTGYVEVNMSLPGTVQSPGFWPAVWSMGNLGRAGYGATTDGMWPYTYAACDVGTLPNQTLNGEPAAAVGLSYLPGQRLSACTCPGGDHPGPSVTVGRGAPEIDVLEAQISIPRGVGQVSQSLQVAPFNINYQFNDATGTPIQGSTTQFNVYKGAQYQQAVSAVTDINSSNYNGKGFGTYAYEWWTDPNNRDAGYIQWYSEGKEAWRATAATLAGDTTTNISSRIIPEEPMYLILNLGMAPSFQTQDFQHMQFPSEMYIDYIRVYQRSDVSNGVGCSPPNRPTANYINSHINAYSNANLTTWTQAGYTFPQNSLEKSC
ncbi:glycoside hydrolase family 16 protein [Russula aff. rugulosa BPL654]|nr:glycoside hydrolase family 16 protein [Russula aff. rugulosa BPL654]